MPESRQRFLIIRLSSIGDIVHTLPAVAALGRAYPQAEIHWAVEDRFSALVESNPFVSRVIRLDTLAWRKNPTAAPTIDGIMRGFDALREFEYDAALDFQGLMKSAIFARLSHAQKRIGFSRNALREPLAGIFYTHRVSPPDLGHVIEINLSLVSPLGAVSSKWEFPLPDNPHDNESVRNRLQQMGVDQFIIVNPGGGWKAKRWSPENFAQLITRLAGQIPFAILVTGSPQEEEVANEILTRANTPSAKWFPSTLLQFIALARKANLLIGGDTGPLHLAAAVRTPIVAIFNSIDPRNTPERNGPFDASDIIIRGPRTAQRKAYSKHLTYLEGVNVESVVEAVFRRLGIMHA